MADKKAAKKLAAKMEKRRIQKDFFAREEALDRETTKKIQDKWYGILLQSKIPEMRENLRNILDYMEKLVEVEVFRKRLFEEERLELSNQIRFQAQSHSQNIDRLYDLYLQRVKDLNNIYINQIKKMREETENEFDQIEKREQNHSDNLQAILFQMKMNEEKKEDSMKCKMFFEIDDEKSKIAEKNERLRTKMERTIEKKWSQISNVLSEYQQRTEKRKNHYIQLQKRDIHDSKVIQSQMRKTQKLNDQIQILKNALENTDPTDSKMILIADYREERLKFYNSFIYLKKVLGDELKLDDRNLKKLTALSKDTLDYLDRLIKKGEKILTLCSLCLKLETEKEKVVPIGRNLHTTKVPSTLVKHMNFPPMNEMLPQIARDAVKSSLMDEFKYFWQKFGKVHLSSVALSQAVADLEKENRSLKKLLHSYFGQMSSKN